MGRKLKHSPNHYDNDDIKYIKRYINDLAVWESNIDAFLEVGIMSKNEYDLLKKGHDIVYKMLEPLIKNKDNIEKINKYIKVDKLLKEKDKKEEDSYKFKYVPPNDEDE